MKPNLFKKSLPIVFAVIFYFFLFYQFSYFRIFNLNKFKNISVHLFSACRRSVWGTKGGGNSVTRIMLHSWVNSDITALPSFITSIIAWPPNFSQAQFACNVINILFNWCRHMPWIFTNDVSPVKIILLENPWLSVGNNPYPVWKCKMMDLIRYWALNGLHSSRQKHEQTNRHRILHRNVTTTRTAIRNTAI